MKIQISELKSSIIRETCEKMTEVETMLELKAYFSTLKFELSGIRQKAFNLQQKNKKYTKKETICSCYRNWIGIKEYTYNDVDVVNEEMKKTYEEATKILNQLNSIFNNINMIFGKRFYGTAYTDLASAEKEKVTEPIRQAVRNIVKKIEVFLGKYTEVESD